MIDYDRSCVDAYPHGSKIGSWPAGVTIDGISDDGKGWVKSAGRRPMSSQQKSSVVAIYLAGSTAHRGCSKNRVLLHRFPRIK